MLILNVCILTEELLPNAIRALYSTLFNWK